MVDTSQILIVAAITVMTVILTVIGIQIIFILKDVRKLLSQTANIVTQIEKVGFNLTHGYGEIIGFVSGMKKMITVIDHISEKKKNKHAKK